MAQQQSKSPRFRMFVALDLPDALRGGIEAWGSKELADPALRPVPAESLHVTLAFLGSRPEGDAERVAAAIEASTVPAPLAELLDPVPRPARGRPRLFALPLLSPLTVELQAGLQKRLVADGLYRPEKRVFWPHVTVARTRPDKRGSRQAMEVARPPGALPETVTEPFRAVRIVLYRSELQPSGARYVPLAQVELPRGRQ